MANTWSKEDRVHFQKSEVMQELEKRVIETIQRAEILQRKIAEAGVPTPADTAAVKEFGNAVEKTTESVDGLSKSLSGAEDDEVAEDGLGLADDGSATLKMDMEGEEDEAYDEGLQNKVVDDLRDLVSAALEKGNIKLAYRIERTIDEILEEDIVCE